MLLSLASFLARLLPLPLKRGIYRIKPLASLVRRALNQAAPAGLTEVEIAAGLAAGFRMALDMRSEKDYWLGTYEPDLQAALRDLLHPGWTVFDVGANVGYITLMLARQVEANGRVFAFEALPENVERLRENVALNGLGQRVAVVPAAVTDKTGNVHFLVGPSDDTGKALGSAGRQLDYEETIEVAGVALDDFVYREGHPAPQAVKMDIEGGEVLALCGMTRLLDEARPLLLLELHGPESARAAWETLTAAGYTLHRMARGFPRVNSLDELDWKAYVVAMPGSDDRQQTTDRGRASAVSRPPSAVRRPPSVVRRQSSTENRKSKIKNRQSPAPLALQQRVLPAYRAPFFAELARAVGDLHLFAGKPLSVEGIRSAADVPGARLTWGRNRHFRHPQSRLYLCWQSGLLAWLRRADPAALILEANPRYLSNWLAQGWMRRRGRPVLGWGLGAPRTGNLLERAFRRAYLRRFDGLIAYSHKGAAEYRAIGLANVTVAVNAVAPRPTEPPPQRPDHLDGPPTVLFVGRLQARKRIDVLLRACAALPAALQPRLLIVGDGPARTAFEALAEQVYPRAEFLGAKHGRELESLFLAADLFVLPGTGGLAVQQAMRYTLPVIVAQGDGTQDDLVRPQNGWQVPPGDVDALRATLRAALSDIPRLRRMGTESYRIVAEEVNLETMVDAFIAALHVVAR